MKKQNSSNKWIYIIAIIVVIFGYYGMKSEEPIEEKKEEVTKEQVQNQSYDFQIPTAVTQNVDFWKNMFTKTSVNEIVFYTPKINKVIKKWLLSYEVDGDIVKISITDEEEKVADLETTLDDHQALFCWGIRKSYPSKGNEGSIDPQSIWVRLQKQLQE